MKQLCTALLATVIVVLGTGPGANAEVEYQLEGNIELEGRFFTNDIDNDNRHDPNVSASIDPIFIMLFDRGNHTITLNPYYRWDSNDDERTHFDIRQASWIGAFGNWEFHVGVDKVFWGVTESAHLVDIINQDDAVEDIDGEDKLGQPLVSASYWSNYGILTVYLMPYFRERTFPGENGRPAGALTVDTDRPIFASGTNNWHPDWAVRYQHSFGVFDVAASYFDGFSRAPEFVLDLGDEGQQVLRPFYNTIKQVGLEAQATVGAWLFKFEGINVNPKNDQTYQAFAAGFEYTFFQAFGSIGDIGIISEYLWDSRGARSPSPTEGDVFVGVRWEGNDVATTRILTGIIMDLDSSAKTYFVEASRRIGDRWRITLDARFFLSVPINDPAYFFADDDFIQLRVARFF
jgi:hypothetical protein